MVSHQPKDNKSTVNVVKPIFAKNAKSLAQPFFAAANPPESDKLKCSSSGDNETITQRRANHFFSPFRRSQIQRKLAIGDTNDSYEREAEVMADKVSGQLNIFTADRPANNSGGRNDNLVVQGKSGVPLLEKKLQKKEEEHEEGLQAKVLPPSALSINVIQRNQQDPEQDEYKYRFNKRNNRKSIFNSLIGRMMHNFPHPYPVLKTLCAYST